MAELYHEIPGPDDLVVCPYDKVHMVRWKKLPYHLMKCRKNHPTRRMKVCHFNARHEVPEEELRYHLSTCPNKDIVERHHLHAESQKKTGRIEKGNTDVPTYFPDVALPEPEEDWDAEALSVPRIGVQPRDIAGIGYIKNTMGMKPAQKRAFQENLRKGDNEANVRLLENLQRLSISTANSAAPSAVPSAAPSGRTSPERPSSPSNHGLMGIRTPTTVPLVARGRGRGLSAQLVSGVVTPGSTAPAPPVDPQKQLRKLKKKLQQIEKLVELQKSGVELQPAERAKVALRLTTTKELHALEARLEILQ